jgi:hypothetical protein
VAAAAAAFVARPDERASFAWRLIMNPWLPLVLIGVLSMPAAADGPDATGAPVPTGRLLKGGLVPRVRGADILVTRLIEEGVRRSPTFRDMVTAVNATDVIVYVERVATLPPGISGQLLIVPMPKAQRYLRVQVLGRYSPFDTIAIIGHELRHVLEVAGAPDVRDESGLTQLYRRIGHRGRQTHSFETPAARNTGRQVRLELAG